jgi:tetratricopeptide (TPR) repeat protein
MIGRKKKLSKKEIKEDTLVTFYYRVRTFYEEFQRNIFIGIGAVAVVVLLGYFYFQNKAANNEKASFELSRVITLYDMGSYLEAIEGRPNTKVIGLKKLVEEYGSTENGETAKIYLANSYYFLGKYDEALKYYQDYSGNNELFEATALAGEAACFEAKKKFEDAADTFMKAASISKENILNPQYMLNAGINYLSLGNKEKAKEVLEKIKKDFSTSTFVRDVDRYLAQIE